MVTKPVLLVLIGITLFGCLGGLAGALVRPPYYQADAIVIVYEMPHDLRQLIGPDEAQQADSIYLAGALQPQVVQRVLAKFPDMTEASLRASVAVSIIAYTPLTRVTATAATPELAVALANAVATNWTTVVGTANDQAYTATVNALKAHEQDLDDQIAATRKAITAPGAKPAAVASLNAQLMTELHELSTTDKTLVSLFQYRLTLIGNAYVTTPATIASSVREPDPAKLAAEGAAGGFAVGSAFVIWLVRRRYMNQVRSAGQAREVGQAGPARGDMQHARARGPGNAAVPTAVPTAVPRPTAVPAKEPWHEG